MDHFAQTNYLQPIGIATAGHPPIYTIAQTGCFLTSFANLLKFRFGKDVDPIRLNAAFRDRGIYIDVDDGVRDDLGWSSITAYDGSVTVVRTGAGAPVADPNYDANNSIVKFIYQSFSKPWLDAAKTKPNIVTHFSLVVDIAKGLIVDSWDGRVKSWNAYGGPKAYATYANISPQPVQAIAAPSPAANVDKQLFLPASAGTWRVYKIGGPYGVGYEINKLAPGKFPPGLTYDILGTLAPNIYKIRTESFGEVAVWAGPDTVAQFRDKPQPAPVQASVVPAPTPTPVAPEPVVEPAPVPVAVTTPEVAVEVAPAVEAPAAPAIDDWKKTRENDLITYQAKENVTVKDENKVGRDLLLQLNQYFKARYHYTKTDEDGQKHIWVQPEFSASQNTLYLIPQTSLKVLKNDITDDQEKEIYDKLDMTLQEVGYRKRQVESKVAKNKKLLLPIVASIEGFILRLRDKFKKQKANK